MSTRKESVLNGKRILAVDSELNVLTMLDEILRVCPDCRLDGVTWYLEVVEKMVSWTYDLVILDIMAPRGFDLLDLAGCRNFPVLILTTKTLTPALERSRQVVARTCFPKESIKEIVPFLENMLQYRDLPRWKRFYMKLVGFFSGQFESDWEKKTGTKWKEWGKL
ncbi:MAG: response regulator [Thermodesulfobacteriota bacterium]